MVIEFVKVVNFLFHRELCYANEKTNRANRLAQIKQRLNRVNSPLQTDGPSTNLTKLKLLRTKNVKSAPKETQTARST